MAESDTHYNGTPEMMNSGNYEEGADMNPGMTNGENNTTVTPLPLPEENTPAESGTSGSTPGNIQAAPLPNPEEGGPANQNRGNPDSLAGKGQIDQGWGNPDNLAGNGQIDQGWGNPDNLADNYQIDQGWGNPDNLAGNGQTDQSWGWLPVIPGYPAYPSISPQYYGQVRFLNASTNSFPVNISIDNSAYAINSRFATVSNYDWISDGFHTITVRRGTGLRSVLLQQTFPFVAGQKVTMVLTDTAAGGLEIIRVIDTGCTNLPYNSGCYRFANMAFSGSSYDLMLYGGETIFSNVRFQNVTAYKQAIAASYQFYVANSNACTFARELPIIVIGAVSSSGSLSAPLVSFQVDIMAGRNYTSYLIGNTWSGNFLQVLTVED